MSEELLVTDPAPDAAPVHIPTPDSPLPKYDRLTHVQLGTLLRLHADGKEQAVIAQALGCSQSAVCRALKRMGTDTSDLAKHYFKAKSFTAARTVGTVLKSGKADEQLKAAKLVLTASGVIEGVSGVNLGVQVIIGTPGQPALDATSIIVSSAE